MSASTYAAAMECFLMCPPIEQELVVQRWLLLLAPSSSSQATMK
jgi:hypothetical protein